MSKYHCNDLSSQALKNFPKKAVQAWAQVPDLSGTMFQVGNVLYQGNSKNEGGIYYYISEISHEISGNSIDEQDEEIIFEGDVYNTAIKTIIQYGSVLDEHYNPCDFSGFGEKLTSSKERERQEAARTFNKLTRNWSAFPTALGRMMIPGQMSVFSLADLLNADTLVELVDYEWKQLIRYKINPVIADHVQKYWTDFVDSRVLSAETGAPQEEWSTPAFLRSLEKENERRLKGDKNEPYSEMVYDVGNGGKEKYVIRIPNAGSTGATCNQEIRVYREFSGEGTP